MRTLLPILAVLFLSACEDRQKALDQMCGPCSSYDTVAVPDCFTKDKKRLVCMATGSWKEAFTPPPLPPIPLCEPVPCHPPVVLAEAMPDGGPNGTP